jgi:predicted nuclease with TOPRIM domain
MIVSNHCLHWEEMLVKLKAHLSESESGKKNLMMAVAELTREKKNLTSELEKLKGEMASKDEELRKAVEDGKKAFDQLKSLSDQMESAKAIAVEEYKLSNSFDDNNTKYFFTGFHR